MRTPAHACLQSTHHRLGVLRRVGFRGVGSAAQWLSPTIDIGRTALRRRLYAVVSRLNTLVRDGEASSGVSRLLEFVHDRDGEVLRADCIADRAVCTDAVDAGALAWRNHWRG